MTGYSVATFDLLSAISNPVFHPDHRYVHISEWEQYHFHRYKILFFLCQPVTDGIEENITRIPDCLGNIVKSVTARINPAFWLVADIVVNSGTSNLFRSIGYIFCQPGSCGTQFKSRSRSRHLLCRIIEQRKDLSCCRDAKYSESTPLASLLLSYPG